MKMPLLLFVGIISFFTSFSQVKIDYVDYTQRLIINNQVIPVQEAFLIGVSYDQLFAIKKSSRNFDKSLLNYYNYLDTIKSPFQLMEEYKYMKTELELWEQDIKNKNAAQINAEVETIWYGGERLLNELGVNTHAKTAEGEILLGILKESAKEMQKDNIIKKRNKEIEDAKRRAKRQLEQALDKKLKPIRDNIILENDNFSRSYLKAAAYAPTQVEQNYYMQLVRYHELVSKYVRQNYSINNLNWFNPNIDKPLKKHFKPNSQNIDFANVALMKYNFYNKSKIEFFNESFKKYLDAAINQNPKNADLFVLKSKAETDVIEKYKYAKYAFQLAPHNINAENQYKIIRNDFINYIFDGIHYNKPYIKECLQKGYQVGLQNERGETPLVVAIKYDRAKLLETIINKYINPVDEINERGHFYLLYAVTNKSLSCINTLLLYGVNINYVDRNGLSALTIALLQENSSVVDILLKHGANNDVALAYIAKNSPNSLDKSCTILYNYDQNNTRAITKYNPDYFSNNYGSLSIHTSEDDAKIYVNDEFVGSGSVNIIKIEKSDSVNIRIQKNDMKEEKFTVPVIRNNNTHVEVNMIKYIPLRSLLSMEDAPWQNYYYEPKLRKTRKSKKMKNVLITAISSIVVTTVVYAASDGEVDLIGPALIATGIMVGIPKKGYRTYISKRAVEYNNQAKQHAEQIAKQKAESDLKRQNLSIQLHNEKISEENSKCLGNLSIKYSINNGEYIYIVKSIPSGDLMTSKRYINNF